MFACYLKPRLPGSKYSIPIQRTVGYILAALLCGLRLRLWALSVSVVKLKYMSLSLLLFFLTQFLTLASLPNRMAENVIWLSQMLPFCRDFIQSVPGSHWSGMGRRDTLGTNHVFPIDFSWEAPMVLWAQRLPAGTGPRQGRGVFLQQSKGYVSPHTSIPWGGTIFQLHCHEAGPQHQPFFSYLSFPIGLGRSLVRGNIPVTRLCPEFLCPFQLLLRLSSTNRFNF
jgi:hypothetical protein